MREVWNFSAGPAQIPYEVLQKAQEEFLSYDNSGMSIVEISHRSSAFIKVMEETERKLRSLLHISDDYGVLFLQGGASLQFAMIPMNLKKIGKAAYINTGNWSVKAAEEAERVGMQVDVIASSDDKNFNYIPAWPTDFSGYDYVHITSNNTLEGTTFYEFPQTGDVPLVADMSSNILSEPLDVSQFGLIYAGAQKNLGIAGLTVVIIKKDLLKHQNQLPKMLDFNQHYEKESAYNTPPTFAIYILGLVLDWVAEQGGLERIAERNRTKAQLLYDYLDQSEMFQPTVFGKDRSIMNIPFITGDDALDKEFIQYCEQHKIATIKGHRLIGGMRASIYNAMPIEGVQALIDVMQAFEDLKGRGTN
ncbi:3-phosphoserine/phosphohydroxythreonine transaminase [Fundicoccus culcitae]|uniref:Phosphoserine aminotransferase n=1 Tax=Fundicoccus culcitae TaxID=2969821 RepID=A0ABY5P5Q8_9LACT|nr:3-phosphoserine/phosphohydroxythreonine transaminase [Fundicoccus culcitae]UUX33733.1 3-phosphoserine/phosphohydroxythreonine transaminase [Fundicoccus culcitae]